MVRILEVAEPTGNVRVDTDFAPDGRYTFATVSGDVKLLLSAGVSWRLILGAVGG